MASKAALALQSIEKELKRLHPPLVQVAYYFTGKLSDQGKARIHELSIKNQVTTGAIIPKSGFIDPTSLKAERSIFKDDSCEVFIYI